MDVSRARCRLPSNLDGLLTSQMLHAIEEANLGRADTQIAKLYMVDRIPQIDIAEELGYGRATVARRLKNITPRVSKAADNLPQ